MTPSHSAQLSQHDPCFTAVLSPSLAFDRLRAEQIEPRQPKKQAVTHHTSFNQP